jgi:penicillin amidase
MARIFRDAYGVPHVRATSVLDLARGQGEVVARDRAWQMEWLRRRATGTTAEMFGVEGLPWDRFARRSLLADTARRAHDQLDDETTAFVAAYVDGVNAGLHADAPELATLGIEPQPWPEWMPLATFHAQHLLFASLGGEMWERRAREVLGDDAALLSHEGPVSSGSNAWAVGGARTASGRPLIGGDPHRVIESPGVYLQIRLACDEFDVAGFTFAGVPGVQHFAHAGDVAWAITNAMGDYQDVHDAGPVVQQWTETIAVRDAEPVEVEVEVTERGPVFTDGLSFRGTSTVLGDLGFNALLPLLRSRTVDDVDRALDAWVEPVNNAVIADRHGAVRYRLAGRIPLRQTGGDGEEWTGWHGPNRAEIAADGQVVTANERRGPESDLVGADFAPAYRADRIHALLEGRDDLTPADFSAIHNDTLLATVALLRALVPGEFDDWDGRMDADSTDAARFAAWRNALVRRIASEPVFAPLHEPIADLLHGPWVDVTAHIGLALPSLVEAGTPYGIDLRELARLALDDSREHPATWGETHVVTPIHAFDATGFEPPELPLLPVDGDGDCVRCTGSLPGVTDEAYRGSVARYVWDLADRQASGWVVPLGADGHPGHAHHLDQLPLWAAGELVPLVTDWDELSEEQR